MAAPPAPPAGEDPGDAEPRTELVASSTLTGFYLGGLRAGTVNAGAKGTVALVMAGTGGALVGSLLASKGRPVPQAMPQMLQNGVLFGTEASLLGEALADPNGSPHLAGVAAAVLGGAVVGLLVSPWLSGGDSGAVTTGIFMGGALPALITGVVQGSGQGGTAAEWAALIGSSAGLIAGPLLNSQLHYPRGRWNLITLGGGVGLLMGGGLAVLTDSWTGSLRSGFLLTAAGGVTGLALMAFLTDGFGDDEPRPGSAAVLHLEDGKLSLGSLAAAVSPARVQERTVPLLHLIDGRI